MNIVLLAFGNNLVYHTQLSLCILSLLKYRNRNDTITIYTDTPYFYNQYAGYVEICSFTSRQMDEWMNDFNYIFRVKIKVIEESAKRHPDSHLLFLDGDTVAYNPLDNILELLDKGKGIMYSDEGHPSQMKGPSLRMWKALAGKSIDNCIVSQRHNTWNSGVIGIPKNKQRKVIRIALDICDFILQTGVQCFTAEQYAFSVAMQEECDVVSAESWILHYWGNKDEWNAFASKFFLEAHMKGLSVEETTAALASEDLTSLRIHVHKSNTQRRLTNIIKKLFPDR